MQNFKKLSLFLVFIIVFTLSLVSCSTLGEDNLTDESSNADESSSAAEDSCLHEITEWIIDKNASCSSTGEKHLECIKCKKTLDSAIIQKTDHTEESLQGTAVTCKTDGLTAGKKCSVCDAVLLEQQIIPKKPHLEEALPGKSATCKEEGLTEGKKCSVCGEVLVEQTALGITYHTPGDWIIDKIAEVGQDGSKHKECSVCFCTIETEVIPAIQSTHTHVGKEWLTITASTCTSKGLKKHVCECGYTMETAEIELADHTEQIIPAVPATCIATGLTSGKKCSVCGEILFSQSPTAKADHSEETVLGKSATCTQSGLTDGKVCTVCTAPIVSQMIIPPKGHNFSEGICLNCGIGEPYGIWIVDGQGKPVSNIIVKVMQNGEQVSMYPYNGEFLAMSLNIGTYEISLDLSQLSENYTFDQSLCTLTPSKKTTTIRLFKLIEETTSIFVGYPISADYDASYIDEGATLVSLTPNDYTFFIFRPTIAAIYTITYESDSDLTISYHGGSFFVQGIDLSTSSSDISKYENGLAMSVYASNLGNEYVIGVKSASVTSCIISIKNAGDPGSRIEDAPWTPYLEDEEKVNEQLNMTVSGTYTVIDLTDLTVKAVYNENDGYYHLGTEDGPIIFIDLTSNSQYVSSIQTICGNQRMGAYIYDAYGKIVEKRSYNELFIQYGMPDSADTKVDSPIRVALTAKLAEAIQSFGDRNDWWDPKSDANIFNAILLGAPYNQEYAWLLFCGYYA